MKYAFLVFSCRFIQNSACVVDATYTNGTQFYVYTYLFGFNFKYGNNKN